jgi:hypothetical protein
MARRPPDYRMEDRQAKRKPMLFSPTVGATIKAG